ncbi:MAG: hypothetical protein P8X98_16540 [Woeseiaceae bacterium]
MNLISELKRRNVFRVAMLYLLTSWLLLQVADVAFSVFALPDWALRFAAVILALGFVPALIFSWVFAITPQGIRRESDMEAVDAVSAATGHRLDLAVVAVGLVAAASFLLFQYFVPVGPSTTQSLPEQAPLETASETDRSIAVLPFLALSNNEEDAFFADGLTEEILNALAALPDLLVTSRTSAFQFKGDDLPAIPEIARRLGVAHILEGSVRRSGNEVRVTVQLIRARDDAHLWSQTYDRQLNDVFGIQEDIAANIAALMGVALDDRLRERLRSSGARNVEAFIAYQRGFETFTRLHFLDNSRLIEAEPYFEQATELEPTLTQAYLYQADYYAHRLLRILEQPGAFDEEAFEAAAGKNAALIQSAIDTADNQDRRQLAVANQLLFSDDWTGAQAALDAVFAQNTCLDGNWADALAALASRGDDFMARRDRLLRCDPLDDQLRTGGLEIVIMNGHFDRAEADIEFLDSREYPHLYQRLLLETARGGELSQRVIDELAEKSESYQSWALARAAARRGEREEAEERATMVLDDPDLSFTRRLSLLAQLGDREGANAVAAQIDERPMSAFVFTFVLLSCVCGAPFDLEAAPKFQAQMEEAGFQWPPDGDVGWPLKDW